VRTEGAETVAAPRSSHNDYWRPPAVPVSQASSQRRLTTTVPQARDRRHALLTFIDHSQGTYFLYRSILMIFQSFIAC
jgi:hypothetical protein